MKQVLFMLWHGETEAFKLSQKYKHPGRSGRHQVRSAAELGGAVRCRAGPLRSRLPGTWAAAAGKPHEVQSDRDEAPLQPCTAVTSTWKCSQTRDQHRTKRFQVIRSCGLAPGLHAWRWALQAGELEGASICSPPLLLEVAGLRPRGPLLVSPVRSRRLEAVFRSPIATVRHRAAAVGSPFPTCFFNTSRNVSRGRSARGSIADAGLPQRR
jgi:hypothetical protein